MSGYEIEIEHSNFSSSEAISIWKEAFPNLDQKRIDWSYSLDDNSASLFYIKKQEKKIGVCGVFPRQLSIKGTNVQAALTGDFVIRKNSRNLFSALALQKAIINNSPDIDVLIGFPNASGWKIQKRVGYEVVGILSRYSLLLRSLQAFRKKLPAPFFYPASFLYDSYRIIKRYFMFQSTNFQWVESVTNEEMDQLWLETKNDYDFQFVKNGNYLIWRYASHPYKSYKILGIKCPQSETLIGLYVYRIENNVVFLDDFRLNEGHLTFEQFFSFFSGRCYKEGYETISLTIMKNPSVEKKILRSGFINRTMEDDEIVCSYALRENLLSGENLSNFIVYGDNDI